MVASVIAAEGSGGGVEAAIFRIAPVCPFRRPGLVSGISAAMTAANLILVADHPWFTAVGRVTMIRRIGVERLAVNRLRGNIYRCGPGFIDDARPRRIGNDCADRKPDDAGGQQLTALDAPGIAAMAVPWAFVVRAGMGVRTLVVAALPRLGDARRERHGKRKAACKCCRECLPGETAAVAHAVHLLVLSWSRGRGSLFPGFLMMAFCPVPPERSLNASFGKTEPLTRMLSEVISARAYLFFAEPGLPLVKLCISR